MQTVNQQHKMPPPTVGRTRGHKWTPFELDAVLALICKGMSREGKEAIEDFAHHLNEALNGPTGGHSTSHFARRAPDYSKDISTRDVKELLAKIRRERKGVLAFIDRQPHPKRITRTQKLSFQKLFEFDGGME